MTLPSFIHSRFATISLPRPHPMTSLRNPFAVALTGLAFGLAGCSSGLGGSNPAPIGSPAASTIRGVIHGGQSPVVNAKVFLYAVNSTDYGVTASTSLLSAAGGSVLTDGNGAFSLTGLYNCPTTSSLVYLLAVGGDPGIGTNNNALAMMAALGNCTVLKANAATTFIAVNEVSTVGAIYALAPFMTSATAIGAPPSNLLGITNAFNSVPNIVSSTYGVANATTHGGNGTVPTALINTLADATASCINSDGSTAAGTPCALLFSATTVNGVVPTNTVDALLSVATHPSNNVSAIYNLVAAAAPFQPTLLAMPNDLTLSIRYAGGGIHTPQSVAVDATGNVWLANTNNTLTEMTAATGDFLTGPSGFSSTTLDGPLSLGIDTAGKIWVANCGQKCTHTTNPSSISVFTPSAGSFTAQNLTGSSLSVPYGLSLDGNNRAWVANANARTVSVFTTAGEQSGATGYTSVSLANPTAVALDSTGNAYVVSPSGAALVEFTSAGAAGPNSAVGTAANLSYPFALAVDAAGIPWVVNQGNNTVVSVTGGHAGVQIAGGGLSLPNGIALDGAGTVWVSNATGSVSAFTKTGTSLSPSTGFQSGSTFANAVAIDGSGAVWVSSCGSYCTGTGTDDGSVYQILGAATPVVTPIAQGAASNKLASRP